MSRAERRLERSKGASDAFYLSFATKLPQAKKTPKRVNPPPVAFTVELDCKCKICRTQRSLIGKNN